MNSDSIGYNEKKNFLFLILGIFFITNVILAELIGSKLFSLEKTLGFSSFDISILGVEHLAFNLTAGVLLWPVVFVMTDIINEYFGKKGVQLLSFIAIGVVIYTFIMVYIAINLSPAGFWEIQKVNNQDFNHQIAFEQIFGQGLWIIIGSIIAFLVSQLIDVTVFNWIKEKTGKNSIWLRATGSTLVSQLVDSFVVLFIAFYISGKFDFNTVIAICIINYCFKFCVAILMTPIIYFVHKIIANYLGSV